MKRSQATASTMTASRPAPVFSKKPQQGFFGRSKSDSFFGSQQSPVIQRKLTVGKANDEYEKQADATADQVVQRLTKPKIQTGSDSPIQAKPLAVTISPMVQSKCAECEKEEKKEKEERDGEELELKRKPIFESNAEANKDEEEIKRKCQHCEDEEKDVQRKPDNSAATAPSSVESGLSQSRGRGTPLPANVNHSMSEAFGTDFSDVRIHTDPEAVKMSQNINAQAFTHGKDIYFNQGKYSTNDTSGKQLLAHELTHTLQQGAMEQSIQRDDCDENSTTKLLIDEVTNKCPIDKGKITDSPKTVNISKLKVKQNAPESILESLGKPITLPKPGSRKDNPTKQIGLWAGYVRDSVTASLQTLLGNINPDQPLEKKKEPQNKYTLKLKTGTGTAVLTGSFTELVNGALVSKWNTEGKTMAFQVEHILDYQIAGEKADDTANLMLLSAAVNNNLGAVMKEYIRSDIQAILTHYNKYAKKGELVTTADEARTNYTIKADGVEKVNPDVPKDQEIVKKSLTDAATDPLRSNLAEMTSLDLKKGQFILKSNKKGGGVILPFKQKEFDIGSYKLTTDGDPEKETISSITAKQIINGSATEEPPEPKVYVLTPVTGELKAYKANDFGNQMANLKLKYLSLVEFEPPDLDEGLNITATGKINAPSPKFLKNTPIEVTLLGRDLSIQKTFSPTELGKVGPIQVDDASLTVSLSTQSGFGASGIVAFSIPNTGKGQIEAKGTKEGFALDGSFDFDTKIFDQATLKVGYDSVLDSAGKNPWTIKGKLVIGKKGKEKGINSATITVEYKNDQLTLNGTADLNVPGVKSAAINAVYNGGDFKITLDTVFDFKSKYIKNPKLTVTLASDDAGLSLDITGGVDIAIPNFKTIGLTVTYKSGLFDATATVNDLKVGKYVTGSITLGATNASVDESGKATGKGQGKQLSLYGSGTIDVTIGETIKSQLGVKLSKEGKILITGKLTITDQKLLKGDLLKFEREIFKIATPNIPIFTIGVGDIFLRIEGSGNAMAKVESPVITIDVDLKETDIFNPAGFTISSTITPKIEAEAGIDLGVKFIVGARALILEIGADIGGAVKLHIKTGAEASLNLTWSPEKGVRFIDAVGKLTAGINVSADIKGGVSVDLNLFLTRINVWRKEWTLASMNFGDLGSMTFKFPIKFNENGGIVTPDINSLKPETPYAEKENASNLVSNKAGGENKVEKKPEDFKKEILSYMNSLPAIGPANPQYGEQRSRHFFVAEVEKGYPEVSWQWLRAEWAALEMSEYLRLADELRQPRSEKGDKAARLKQFAIDHPTVSKENIDILAAELKLVNFDTGPGKVQKKEQDIPILQTREMVQKDDEPAGKVPQPQEIPTWDPEDALENFVMEYEDEQDAEKAAEKAEAAGDPWEPVELSQEGPSAWMGYGAKGLRKNIMIHSELQKLSTGPDYKQSVINSYKDREDPAGAYVGALKSSIDAVADSETDSMKMINNKMNGLNADPENFIDIEWFKGLDGGNAFPGFTWAIVRKLVSPPDGLMSSIQDNLEMSKRYYESQWSQLAMDMFRIGLPVSYIPSLSLSYYEFVKRHVIDKLDTPPEHEWMINAFIRPAEEDLFSALTAEYVKAFAYYGSSTIKDSVIKKWSQISEFPWMSFDTRAISDFRKEYPNGLIYVDSFYKFEHKGVAYSLGELAIAVLLNLVGVNGGSPYKSLGFKSGEARDEAPQKLMEFVSMAHQDFAKDLQLADEMIAGLLPDARLAKAIEWSISKGFAGASINILLDNLDNIILDIIKEWGEQKLIEKGATVVIGIVGGPIGRLATFLYNAYRSYQDAKDLYEITQLANKIFSTVNDAENSKTVIDTQKSAARLAELTVSTIPLIIQLLGSKILSKLKKGAPKDKPDQYSAATRKDILDKTHDLEKVSDLAREPKYLRTELDTASTRITKSTHPDYEIEATLPNGHVWRRNSKGVWCRFSPKDPSCMFSFKDLPNDVREEMEDLNSRADSFKETSAGVPISKEDMDMLSKSKHPPGANEPNQRTTLGSFIHGGRFKEFCNWLETPNGRKWLEKEGLTSADLALDLPEGSHIKREFVIEDPYAKGKPRADIVDFENATVHEIKPAGQEAKGFAEAQDYADRMNKYHKRPDGVLWTAGPTYTYDANKIFEIFKKFGYFK